jgi:hypothetical protein
MFGLILINTSAGSKITAGQLSITEGESFDISISLYPTQPVKSYEFKLSFDPAIFRVDSIEPGDFFEGWQVFYSPNYGIIDNVNGTVINSYALIVGMGNTSDSGTLLVYKCTALAVGMSQVRLIGAGATNETKYVDLEVENGAVLVLKAPDKPIDNEPDNKPDNKPNINDKDKTPGQQASEYDYTPIATIVISFAIVTVGLSLLRKR